MNLYEIKQKNIRKTWLLMAVFFGLIVGLGWLFYVVYGNIWFFYGAAIFSLVMELVSFWFSDKIALKLSGAVPADPQQYRELSSLLENLSIAAGLPTPKLYIIHDPAPNAFATGRDPQHAAVAVTTGLLEVLDKPELEGVLAHELSHIKNRDILVMSIAVVLVGFLSMLADMFLRFHYLVGDDRKNIHPIFLIGVILAVILAPIAGNMISLAVSRKREYLADASGALLTRYPEGLARALEKIANYGKPMKHASHATAHLFISNPFGNQKEKSLFAKLEEYFSTHPPIEKRIQALRNINIS